MLHSDRDHQILFVGGPNKSKMADGRHLKNQLNCYISATFRPVAEKFGMTIHVDHTNHIGG